MYKNQLINRLIKASLMSKGDGDAFKSLRVKYKFDKISCKTKAKIY